MRFKLVVDGLVIRLDTPKQVYDEVLLTCYDFSWDGIPMPNFLDIRIEDDNGEDIIHYRGEKGLAEFFDDHALLGEPSE